MNEYNGKSTAPISYVLTELQSADFPSIPLLYRLSDLSPGDFGEFCSTWSEIDREKRRVIVRHLADLSEENYVVDFADVFAHCLDDDEPEVRKASLDGLWDSERVTLIQRIIDLMEKDPDLEVRVRAATNLGHYVILGEWGQIPQHTTEPIIDALLSQLQNESHLPLRYAALEAVSASGHPRADSFIHEIYDSAEIQGQKSALFAMGRSADAKWVDIVIDEMSSPEVELRFEAARAAGEIGHKSAVPELIELTADEDEDVRFVAVHALGQIGGDISRRYLEELADDPDQDEDLSEAAWDAVQEIDIFGDDIDLSLVDFDG